jgi:hypothetical protein
MWPLVALLFVGLGIAVNFGNALIVRATPGFGSISVVDLVLLWCSRPRVSWMAACFVFVGKENGVYFSTGASALVAELVLQAMGAVYLGRSVHFAAIRNYYYSGHVNGVVVSGENALLMYSGALLWIVAIGAALCQIAWSFLGLRTLLVRAWKWITNSLEETNENRQDRIRSLVRARMVARLPAWIERSKRLILENLHLLKVPTPRVQAIENQEALEGPTPVAILTSGISWRNVLSKMGLSEDALKSMTFVALWMVPPFIGQWLFWAGFVRLADEL